VNIFVLDESPLHAARMVCDSHTVKMPVEGVQMLVQALLTNGAPHNKMPLTKKHNKPHRGGYPAHPCTLWAGASAGNWVWLYLHTRELCKEYTKRYGKTHFAEGQLAQLRDNLDWGRYFKKTQRTPFVRAINQSQNRNLDLLSEDITAVSAYRNFYVREKARFAKWEKGTEPPKWWPIPDCKEASK